MNFYLQRGKEVWRYRGMIFSLVRRELRGRYKRSFLGFAWTFLNPLLQLLVYTIVFSSILRVGVKNYPLFLFVALIPWAFFSAALTGGCRAVVAQGDMVKKIAFPRETLPISYVTAGFVNMLCCFVVIFAVMAVSGAAFNARALCWLPFVLASEYVLCLGVALLVSAVAVYCRDLEYMLGIAAMMWMYLTPVLYPLSMAPSAYRALLLLNPMTPVIAACRDILYAARSPDGFTLAHSCAAGWLALAAGWRVFDRLQRGFAEEL